MRDPIELYELQVADDGLIDRLRDGKGRESEQSLRRP